MTTPSPQTFSWLNTVLLPLVSSGGGAFIAVLIKDSFDKSRDKRLQGAKDIQYLCSMLVEVKEMSILYWAEDYENISQQRIWEGKIRGNLHGILTHLFQMKSNFPKDFDEIHKLLREVRWSCTSGNFESKGREKDTSRISEIVSSCFDLEAQIMAARRR